MVADPICLTRTRYKPRGAANRAVASEGQILLRCFDKSPDCRIPPQSEAVDDAPGVDAPRQSLAHLAQLPAHRLSNQHPVAQLPPLTLGDVSSVLTVRDYSAVTGACVFTRREVFDR